MPDIPVHHILFLDIETVPQYPAYAAMPAEWQSLWDQKSQYLTRNREDETAETIYPRAGIYAEFGKIVCISCGYISGRGAEKKLMLKSFAGNEEKTLLQAFTEMVRKWSAESNRFLCAHNGKEFDFPYLCRRMIVNRVEIPPVLNMAGKKPWEVNHLDTMELWKFGDFKHYTSLNLLAHALGIPTPKDDIDGSRVWEVYWVEKNLERIVTYCQKDVVTIAQVYLKMQNEEPVGAENILIR